MIDLRTISYAYYVIWYTAMVISFSSSESSIFEVWTCGCCGLEKLDQDDNVGDAEMTYKGYLVVTKISLRHGEKYVLIENFVKVLYQLGKMKIFYKNIFYVISPFHYYLYINLTDNMLVRVDFDIWKNPPPVIGSSLDNLLISYFSFCLSDFSLVLSNLSSVLSNRFPTDS